MENSVHAYRETLVAQLTELQRLLETERESSAVATAALAAELAQSEAAREAEAQEARETATALRAHNALLSTASHRLHAQYQSVSTEAATLRSALEQAEAATAAAQRGAAAQQQAALAVAAAREHEAERQKAIERTLLAHELESHEGLAVELLAAQMQEAGRLRAERKALAAELVAAEMEYPPARFWWVERALEQQARESQRAQAELLDTRSELRRCAADLAEALPQLRALAEGGGDDARWEAARAVETAEAVLSAGVGLGGGALRAASFPPPTRLIRSLSMPSASRVSTPSPLPPSPLAKPPVVRAPMPAEAQREWLQQRLALEEHRRRRVVAGGSGARSAPGAAGRRRSSTGSPAARATMVASPRMSLSWTHGGHLGPGAVVLPEKGSR